MKRTMRLGLPVLGVAALIAVMVLLATRGGEEAAAGTIQYRACDFVIDAPVVRQKGGIRVTLLIEPGVESSLMIDVLGEPDASIVIDPTSDTGVLPVATSMGDVAALDARLQPVLDTLRIEPLNPSTAPWPYTETVQRPPIYHEGGTFRHRLPDPGSGLVVTMVYANMTDGSIVHTLSLANCRSVMERMVVFRRGEEPEVTDLTDDVHTDDQAAFQTFFDEVDIHEPAGV